MFNVLRAIWEWLGTWKIDWEVIKSVISMLGDVCLFFITVYTFRLTVLPKKLKFIDFRFAMNVFYGGTIEVVLENRSLCPVVVKRVELIIDSHRIEVCNFNDDGGCIVEIFKTATIKSKPYTEIVSKDSQKVLHFNDLSHMSLWIETSRGNQHIRFDKVSKILHSYQKRKLSSYKLTKIFRVPNNEDVVSRYVKYIVKFTDKKEDVQTVRILESGTMDKALFGCNHLPTELVENEQRLREYLDLEFTKHNFTYTLQKIDGV